MRGGGGGRVLKDLPWPECGQHVFLILHKDNFYSYSKYLKYTQVLVPVKLVSILLPVFIFPFLMSVPDRFFLSEPGEQSVGIMKTGKIRKF